MNPDDDNIPERPFQDEQKTELGLSNKTSPNLLSVSKWKNPKMLDNYRFSFPIILAAERCIPQHPERIPQVTPDDKSSSKKGGMANSKKGITNFNLFLKKTSNI